MEAGPRGQSQTELRPRAIASESFQRKEQEAGAGAVGREICFAAMASRISLELESEANL
jgi:hypothetical protein